MPFRLSRSMDGVAGVYLNDTLLDPASYTRDSEGMALTLKADYLDKLPAGKYTLRFQYNDNASPQTEFTITKSAPAITTDLGASYQTGAGKGGNRNTKDRRYHRHGDAAEFACALYRSGWSCCLQEKTGILECTWGVLQKKL